MRTPKHETLIRYGIYLTNYITGSSHKITILPLDNTSINSNSWAAGFIDADGNFPISINKRKKGKTHIVTRFAIEQHIIYHRYSDISEKSSYFPIIINLSENFNGSVYSRSRILNNNSYVSFTIITFTNQSNAIVIDYLEKYPLWSSKYLDYLSWKKIVQTQASSTNVPDIAIVIRKDYDKTRTTYNWDHLGSRI